MKAPRFLIGATLIFWGWQADMLIPAVIMAAIIEGSAVIKARWELSDDDLSRIWTFCNLLFLAFGVYGFTSSDGPSRLGDLMASNAGGRFSATNAVETATAKTAVLLIRSMPMAFFLLIAAQVYSDREGIPLETISLILRRRRKQARELRQPLPTSRILNLAYPYFIICLFAASGHSLATNTGFLAGLCGLLAWGLWPERSRRFGMLTWAATIILALALGYTVQIGMVRLRQAILAYNPSWLSGSSDHGFDPMESRTAIGQIGRIETSWKIVIRLQTTNGQPPPRYLREAAYRTYKNIVWYAGGTNNDFQDVLEQPLNSDIWPLVPGLPNTVTLNIACYLPTKGGVLPLPTACHVLENLPVDTVETNAVGSVRAKGPGLVIFDALSGPGKSIDEPPDTNEDLGVPDREKPALEEIISQMNLTNWDYSHVLQSVSSYLAAHYSYSLWQEGPRFRDTNTTPLGRFLLKTRSGHCEYFATATVLLLRELGIPARYTVGYAVHEGKGDSYVVRQCDAHAWCRVWDADTREWENFDTTPGTWIDAQRARQPALQSLYDAWSRFMFEFSKFRWGQSHFRIYIFWSLVPILAVLLYQIIFRSGKRRKGGKHAGTNPGLSRPGLDSEFYQLEKTLASRGLVRVASEPLNQWLRRVAGAPEFTAVKDPLLQSAELHYRYRFDPRGLSDAERERLRRETARCLALLSNEDR